MANLRARMECKDERKRLGSAIGTAREDVLGVRRRYGEVEIRYGTILQENASLMSNVRRLEENLNELRRSGHQA